MRYSRAAWFVVPTAALTVAIGCSTSKPTALAPEPTATVSVTKISYEGLDQAVKSYQGKVVMLDVWFRA